MENRETTKIFLFMCKPFFFFFAFLVVVVDDTVTLTIQKVQCNGEKNDTQEKIQEEKVQALYFNFIYFIFFFKTLFICSHEYVVCLRPIVLVYSIRINYK